MASTCCSCRTSALRSFVRSVTQIHLPNELLPKAAPLHEARRQPSHRGRASLSAPGSLPYRSIHTFTKASVTSAAENEKDHDLIEAQERESGPPGKESMAADESQPGTTDGGSTESCNLKAKDAKPFETLRARRAAKRKQLREATATQSVANPAMPSDSQRRNPPQVHDEVIEDPEMEKISVEEIEAEQKERELNRLRMRAERARAREQAKKEQERLKEEERKQREKERLKARPDWAAQKAALKEKFPEGWQPRKKLSPDALNGIRALHRQFPDTYTNEVLANKFEVSPEAIRRILRSKWEASAEEEEDRERRWHNRGVNIWQHYAAIGKKPPVKWREAGVTAPPRRERNRDSREHDDFFNGYAGLEKSDGDVVDAEQMKRVKRQQRLAKQLV